MAGICVGAMLSDDFVVGGEKRAKWESLGLGVPLGANDDLVEEADIWRMSGRLGSRDRGRAWRKGTLIPSSERDEFSSVTARR